MDRFKDKLTPTFLIAVVLVLGLLTAGSAALLKGSPQGEVGAGSGDAVAERVDPDAVRASTDPETPVTHPTGDMPRTLPMPPRQPEPPREFSMNRGVPRNQMLALLSEVFGSESEAAAEVGQDAEPETTELGRPESESWANAYVTRADVAEAVVVALQLEEVAQAHAPVEPIFRDVPGEHRAYGAIAMLHRLGLYPFHVGTLFAPDEPVQWAEVKFTIEAARGLETVHGPIVHVNAPARTVSVEWTPRHAIAYIVDEGTLIARNGEAVSLERLQPGDEVRAIADQDGRLFVATAIGPEGSAGISSEWMTLVRELATPEQLAAIISRDWERAAVELKGSVYNQLLEQGATPEEAEALLAKDWSVVEERTKARLTELISDSTEVNEDLVRAVLDGDWDAALSFVEVEVLEYVLNYLVV